jgi:2-polyprenyl-3-methyl-5-hydroxy-6-metoxy-1,4-benzoquinol methylase
MNQSNNTAAYGWETTDAPASCGYVAPKVLHLLQRLRPGRILDLGCGNGQFCKQAAAVGHEVVGLEVDPDGVRIARQNNPHIRFYNYGVQDDPQQLLANEAGRLFDTVVSTEVVEHLFAPHLLPAYAHRVLSPGGHLIVSTPYHGYLKNLALSVFDGWDRHHTPLWHGGHIKFWSQATLTRLLEENGFRVVSFDAVGRLPYLWKSMILTALKF